MKSKSRSSKKILISVIICIAVAMAIMFFMSHLIDKIASMEEENSGSLNYNFYEADFEENIYEDESYMMLLEGDFIRFSEKSIGMTTGISKNDIAEYPEDVRFILEYIFTIVDGDHEKYNSMFSEEYYANNEPKERFTMQRLNNVEIVKRPTETVSDNTGNYTKYCFEVEYSIIRNNGTFRNDIGDGSKKQYITVTNKNGELLIDNIQTP